MLMRLGLIDFNEGGLEAVTEQASRPVQPAEPSVNAAGYDKGAGHNNILGIDGSDKMQIQVGAE